MCDVPPTFVHSVTTMKKNDHLHIRIDPLLKQALEMAAQDRGLSLSRFVRDSIVAAVVGTRTEGTP
jgi:uncharacterized protein (DUF1778 family)